MGEWEPLFQNGHCVYETPWNGDPRVNIQSKKGMARAYLVKQGGVAPVIVLMPITMFTTSRRMYSMRFVAASVQCEVVPQFWTVR